MDESELDRFASSKSCIKNLREDKSKSRSKIGAYTIMAMGTFALLAFVGLVFIFKTDSKSTSFDELVTTGGAVRRSLENVGDNMTFTSCNTKECQDVRTYILDSMSKPGEVNPCDNFYQFACKGWIAKNPIPKTSSTFSTFSKLNQKVEHILRAILESKDKETEIGMLKYVKKFYRSCMNCKTINRKGRKPMLDLIKSIGSWSLAGNDGTWDEKKWDFFKTLLQIQKSFTSSGGPLISVHVSDDPRHSTRHILEIDQAGPSLPREIYMNKDKRGQTLTAYNEYLQDCAYEICKPLKCEMNTTLYKCNDNNCIIRKYGELNKCVLTDSNDQCPLAGHKSVNCSELEKLENCKKVDCLPSCNKEAIKKQADDVIEFETKLAECSVPDDIKQESWFNRMKFGDLIKKIPEFPFKEHVNEIFAGKKEIKESEEIIVPALSYLQKFMDVVKNTPKSTLSNYMVWSVIQDEIPYLSYPFRKIRMHYKEKVLGSKGMRARWKTCVSYTNEYLGEILGKLYVKRNFNDKTKKDAQEMIVRIRKAFQDNVKTLDWMDSVTKARVQEKAGCMKDQVGYPGYLNNETRFRTKYEKLKITDDLFFQNRLNMIAFAHERMIKKINEPVDKTEWPMDPQTINAMYSFNENGMSKNTITFPKTLRVFQLNITNSLSVIPGGILQRPFYHTGCTPVSMRYGAIGAILGHELTHGFDNTGRKFNKHGELRSTSWWSNSSTENFKKNSQCMVDQYSKYKVRGKFPLNGKLTLGENIADNGGLKTALRAYNDYMREKKKDKVLEGLPFTNKQLFFISFAQAYCSNSRENEQYLATLNDRHSEEEFRVIGTLSNCKEFAKAFQCPIGSRMNPSKKCYCWVNPKYELS